MRSLPMIGVAAIIALSSSLAWAQSPQQNSNAAPAKTADPDEVICVHHTDPGTRIPGPKECHTRRVWDQMSNDARQNTQDLQNRSGTLSTTKGG